MIIQNFYVSSLRDYTGRVPSLLRRLKGSVGKSGGKTLLLCIGFTKFVAHRARRAHT